MKSIVSVNPQKFEIKETDFQGDHYIFLKYYTSDLGYFCSCKFTDMLYDTISDALACGSSEPIKIAIDFRYNRFKHAYTISNMDLA